MIARTTTTDPDRQRILEAAERLFFKHGFQRVSMDEIAADMGMSKKTIYKHFPGKDRLMTEIVREMLRSVEAKLAVIAQTDRPVTERLVAFFMVAGTSFIRLTKEIRADLVRHAPALWKEVEVFRRKHAQGTVFPMLRMAKEEGVIRADVNLDLFFLIFLTTIEGIVNPATLAQQPFSAEEALRGIFKTLMRGILTEEAARSFENALPLDFSSESSRII